ncbi:MAG: 2-oxoacid:ferredoxin oxidoreductase subunit beta [Candidatus Aenigmarchaeota archaeon]|nr:2-oxoacid:ferredoxin oxidoreductase subunit beta [Candidatus Aenigmarchaeota archaeon]
MTYKDYKRPGVEPIWCLGCGLHVVFTQLSNLFDELEMEPIVLSGIGCTGRTAGYFNLDTVHGLHGRIIPLAEGVKRARKDKEVIVVSGDGDLLSIGGNHLLHTSRRDINMTVICVNNSVYGLTGGQLSPTTPKGAKTKTTPGGSEIEPIDAQKILMSNKRYFYARTTPVHVKYMKEVIKQAIEWDGFAFVEIISLCLETIGKTMGLKKPSKMYNWLEENFRIVENKQVLDDFELGVVKNG